MPPALTGSASYPDRETAQWATRQVVTAYEQLIHRWLAQGTRARLTIEAAWPSHLVHVPLGAAGRGMAVHRRTEAAAAGRPYRRQPSGGRVGHS
ncbi:RNase A-like domain-containing protein [Streptomyces fradiae]|uniref:RNase A-like domain-containing protein n=1 Tax=Streptomyces fradiae TaxID=1906 RepID=UPI003F4D6D54